MVPKNIFLSRERVINSTRGTLEEISVQGLQPGTSYRVRVVAQAAEVSSSRSKYFLRIVINIFPRTRRAPAPRRRRCWCGRSRRCCCRARPATSRRGPPRPSPSW